ESEGLMPTVHSMSLVELVVLTTRSPTPTERTTLQATLADLVARLDGEDPNAVSSPVHMSALPLKAVRGTFARPKGITITTQFGTYTADVQKVSMLLAPTAKSLTSLPPPLVTDEPHRLCNKLVHVSGPAPMVHVDDQFLTPGGLTPSINPRGPDT